MLNEITKAIEPKIKELQNHKIYAQIDTIDKLKLFMERHVYAVFDFMSLAKSLQREFAPANKVWTPPTNKDLARFLNEIILTEESDITPSKTYMSHFEMYCVAMAEIKADCDLVRNFVQVIAEEGLPIAQKNIQIPQSAFDFLNFTFNLVHHGEIHEIAASFCFGREKIIPNMFKALLEKINVQEKDASTFYYYLERHIEVDSDSHGPLALNMLSILCGNDKKKWEEAKSASLSALDARINFWNAVSQEIFKIESNSCSFKEVFFNYN